jgi:hypothetical protein
MGDFPLLAVPMLSSLARDGNLAVPKASMSDRASVRMTTHFQFSFNSSCMIKVPAPPTWVVAVAKPFLYT